MFSKPLACQHLRTRPFLRSWDMEFEQYMTEGVRKAGNRSITFSNDVELYVGHEFDIEMTRCVSKLEMPSSCHPVFQPASHLESEVELEEDEDASLLAVHAAHLRILSRLTSTWIQL